MQLRCGGCVLVLMGSPFPIGGERREPLRAAMSPSLGTGYQPSGHILLLQRLARGTLPASFRRYLSQIHRNLVFNRALARFLRNPAGFVKDRSLISALVYGWGNERWSADEPFLREACQIVAHSRGPILECGSGLSTLLLGSIAQLHGLKIWSLEHNAGWGHRVESALRRYGIRSVNLYVAPLRRYGSFDWYAPQLDSMPESFSAVICDGPPGDTRGSRYGLLPVMTERLRPGTVILLDDASRDQEKNVVRRWALELGASFRLVQGDRKAYALMTVPGTD